MQKMFKRNSTMVERIRRTQHHVSKNLVIGHLDMAYSYPQAKNFFELELDGGTNFSDFVAEVFTVGDRRREFAG